LTNYRNSCRVCGGLFFSAPLLRYENSPIAAQGFLNRIDDPDDAVNLEIFQCSKCGLVQHSADPVSYYKDVIRAVAVSNEMADFRLNQLNDWVSLNQLQDKKILEVGCGKGEYLNLLRKAGANHIRGMEHAYQSVDEALQNGNHVYQGYLDDGFKPPSDFTFDAFAIFSFLEHWPDPNHSLSILHSFLTEDACGLIEVPNFELIQSRGLYSEFTTDHIFYFDKKSFTFLLEKNGFEVMSMTPIWYDYILSAQVRRRSPLDIHHFLDIQEKVTRQLSGYINKFREKSVAIWGAGHQALAVLARTKVAVDLKYIVDSAPFKQGKYTPVTHLLVTSPETLLIDPPEAVVVMAAGYSSEVVRSLLAKYPLVRNVAILREDTLEVVK